MAKGVFGSGEGKIEISFDDGSTFVELVDVTAVNISSSQNRDEWIPYNQGGWSKNYITSKTLTFSIEKKYNATNEADKKLIETVLKLDAYEHNYAKLKFTLPQVVENATAPAKLEAEVSLSITDIVSQASEDVAPLNFEAMVNGKPVYTEETTP